MAAQAFVLHLIRARARRENAEALLRDCGLPGEIVAAVDGAALDPAERTAQVGADLFEPRYPFGLRPGEIGCFLSHRQIWAEIVRRDLDHALVLEDDVTLDARVFAHALDLATRNAATCGYIQLQNRPVRGKAQRLDQQGPCEMFLAEVTPLRTSAQLVSRAAATRLLAACERIDRPVDSLLQAHWHTGLRPVTIYPAGVRTIAETLAGSTIQAGRKPLSEKLWREGARMLYRRRVRRLSRQSPAPLPEVAG